MKIVGEATDGEEALAIVAPRAARHRDHGPRDAQPQWSRTDETRPARTAPHEDHPYEFAHRLSTHGVGCLPTIRDMVAQPECETPTLGDLLYANRAAALVSEKEWVGLVRSTTGGDQSALQELYTRTHRIVFTLIGRITNNRDTAEEVAVEVFHDVWRRSSAYDPAGGSVVGWIMNQARSRAIARASREALDVREQARRTDVLRPSGALWERLAQRIVAEKGQESVASAPQAPPESEWEEVASGISWKLLAADAVKDRVSMLVRLAPGAAYPPHSHAGVEELYLLDGELMIDGRTLYPGDYNRAEPGTGDEQVWSETGCTCVLLTSTRDVLR